MKHSLNNNIVTPELKRLFLEHTREINLGKSNINDVNGSSLADALVKGLNKTTSKDRKNGSK